MTQTTTGVTRLDELLGGGLPAQTTTLLYGPPFVGKEVLARRFVLAGLAAGEPAVVLTTGHACSDFRKDLSDMDPAYKGYEDDGMVRYVDTYSRQIGAEDDFPYVEYVDGAIDLNSVSLGVNNAQRGHIERAARHRLLVDNLSTLITYTNPPTVFRFLQVLLGRARRAGATTIAMLDAGMHTDAEVQMFKHLVDGVIEVREQDMRTSLNVHGLGIGHNPGWVDYSFGPDAFEVTGSFAAGRIR